MPPEESLPVRTTLQEIKSPTQAQYLPVAQHFLERPTLTAPAAQPTPEKPQALATDQTEDSASFSPDKAHQFSQVCTPQTRGENAASRNGPLGFTPNGHTPAGKSGSRQRLT